MGERCTFERIIAGWRWRCPNWDTEQVSIHGGPPVWICYRHRSWLPAMGLPEDETQEGE